MPGISAPIGQRQVARIAGQQPPLPVLHTLAGVHFVALFRIAKQRKLRVAPVDQVRVGQQARNCS
jgi:hypothetical protein